MNVVALLALLALELVLFRIAGQPLDLATFLDLMAQSGPVLVLAFGMTLVLTTAGIDLSVGSATALVASVMAQWRGDGSFWLVALPLGLALGLTLGATNGTLVAFLNLPPIVATLGTMIFYRGLCYVILRDSENGVFLDVPGYAVLGEPMVAMVLTATLYGAAGLYFWRSAWRRELRLLGGNRTAARYAGVPVFRRLWEVYTLLGALVFLAALLHTARNGAVSASALLDLEMKVILAVVLGGTRVNGGSGSLPGTLLGVLVIAVLDEGLRGAALTTWSQQHLPFPLVHLRYFAFGGLFLLAVSLNERVGRLR